MERADAADYDFGSSELPNLLGFHACCSWGGDVQGNRLEKRYDAPNAYSMYGAIVMGDAQAVEFLLKSLQTCVSRLSRNSYQKRCLELAAECNRNEVLSILLDAGIKPNTTTITELIESGNIEGLDMVRRHGHAFDEGDIENAEQPNVPCAVSLLYFIESGVLASVNEHHIMAPSKEEEQTEEQKEEWKEARRKALLQLATLKAEKILDVAVANLCQDLGMRVCQLPLAVAYRWGCMLRKQKNWRRRVSVK
jgi:hypothetical protein